MKKSNTVLEKIFTFLQENDLKITEYAVPNVWLDAHLGQGISSVSFNEFYLRKIGEVLVHKKEKNYAKSLSVINNEHHGIGGDWSYQSVVYNAFTRLTAAYDHNQKGNLKDYKKGKVKIKKTGTFLKLITMLPYIKSLGVNTLHLMPITSIGKDGNRGDLGSSYAIKNPYEIDENLAETAIPFSVEEQFAALVEACHIMDIRVVLEFVLRTASLDSDWIKKNPEWFYWIDKKQAKHYKSPAFSKEDLKEIKKIPEGKGAFIPPSADYQNLFKNPPQSNQIKKVKGKYIAKTKDGEIIIPGAFADWPPDDVQPPWNDVTYLKLYNDVHSESNFNYIAYNTIRFYDNDLAKPQNQNQALWNALTGIIPHYQKNFGIDGIMLDMGHALPDDLMENVIEEARSIDHDFGFWEENFELKQSSRWTGFNASLGFEWKFREKSKGMRNMLLTASNPMPLPFLGTPETHNTPRIQNTMVKKHWWTLNCLLPSCLPFIHSGFELNEKNPINTGLNFTPKELEALADFPLALFNRQSYDWDCDVSFLQFMQKIGKLRTKNQEWIATGDERTLTIHYPENNLGQVIAFERNDAYQPWKSILVLINTNLKKEQKFFLNLHGTYNNTYTEYLTRKQFTFDDHWLSSSLAAGQIVIFELHKLI